jgi:site-specific recombinase XerD
LRRLWDEDIAETAEAVKGFERLTYHCCRHGFATEMLRDGADAKTAAYLGGWEDITLFMETYAHAIEDTTLNERLFGGSGAKVVQSKSRRNKNKRLA